MRTIEKKVWGTAYQIAVGLYISLVIQVHASGGFGPRTMISEFDSTFAQLADLDGDGDLDVIAGDNDEDLSWFENLGGTGESWQLHVIGTLYFRPIAIGDLDGDGDIDIACTQYVEEPESRKLVWWENLNGDASSWTHHPISSDFGNLVSLSFADIDKDSDLDVLVSDDEDIAWFENRNGDGTLWQRNTIEAPNLNGYAFAEAADLDGDGDLDVISRLSSDQAYWHENLNGSGTSWNRTVLPGTNIEPHGAAYVDLDEDGDIDVILGDRYGQSKRIVFWLENVNGDGSLWNQHDLPVTLGEVRDFGSGDYISCADIDHDGDLDLVIGSWDDCLIIWWENLGAEESWQAHFVADVEEPTATRLGDFDGDGDLDILGASREDEGVFWIPNVWKSPGIQFPDPTSFRDIHDPVFMSGPITSADLDGDGDMDLITSNSGDDDVHWEENVNGDGSVWTKHAITGDLDLPQDVIGTDIDCDGDIDVLALGLSEISIWINSDGSGSFVGPLKVALAFAGPNSMAVGDLDDDGDKDIIVGITNSHGFLFYIENTDGTATTWEPPVIFTTTASLLSEISLADLDGDGDLDVLSTSVGNRALVWSENDGDGGTWTAHTINIAPFNPIYAAAADADGDGDLDIFAAHESGVSWWKNSGTDTWEEHPVPSDLGMPTILKPHDFDRDGDIDVVTYDGQKKTIHYLENLNVGQSWQTKILPAPKASPIKEVMALELADLTGDGLADICLSGTLEEDDKLILSYWSPAWKEEPPLLPLAVTSIRQVADDQLEIIWNAEPGCDYEIEMSTDLQTWTRRGYPDDIIRAGATLESKIVTPPVGGQRIFYRVILREKRW